MMRNKINRNLLCAMLCLVAVVTSVLSAAAAENESRFSLVNLQSEKVSECLMVLECSADRKVAAFVAQIQYDPEALEYKSLKALNKDAKCEVNYAQQGQLRLVYLCEEGADCKNAVPLLEIKFKALQKGEHTVTLNMEQVIDCKALAFDVTCEEGAVVKWESSSAQSSASSKDAATSDKTDKENSTSSTGATSLEETATYSPSATRVEPAEQDVVLIVSSVGAVLVLVCLVGYCAYKLGLKKQSKEKVPSDKGAD